VKRRNFRVSCLPR